MKGLILKDFINLKKNVKIFAGLTILYGVLAMVSDDTSFFSSILTMLIAILTLTLYSYDEMSKWETFALTMPISKDDIIKGKYLMMLFLTFIGVIYSTVFTAIINIALVKGAFYFGFDSIAAGAAVVILFFSTTIPFITKMGVEKARLIFVSIYIIPFAVIMGLDSVIRKGKLKIPQYLIDIFDICMKYIFIILPIIVLIALGISYAISIRIYRKREF